MSVTVGSLVKISPSIFEKGTFKMTDLYGKLGYSGVLKFFTFRVKELYEGDSKGIMAKCELVNPEETLKKLFPESKEIKFGGMPYILVEDLVKANEKISLSYFVENDEDKAKLVADLFVQRKKLRSEGFGKESKPMIANWTEITRLRKSDGTVKVVLPKQRLAIEMKKSELPKIGDEEAEKKFLWDLSSRVTAIRSGRKDKKKSTKKVFGQELEYSGGVFTKAGSVRDAFIQYIDEVLDQDKVPTEREANYVGIEIEMILSNNGEFFRQALIKNNLHKHVTIKEDGSLRVCHNSGGYGTMELTIICKNTEISSVMQRIGKILNHPKVDAYVNRSCGLHVHVDMRNRNPELAYKNLVMCQDIFRGAQPVGRIKNTHCRPNKSSTYDFKGRSSSEDRYVVVNPNSYSKHKTIEIRIHEGTTDYQNIIDWTKFLDAIASHPTELVPTKKLTHASQLVELGVNITPESVMYVDRRVDKFCSLQEDMPVA